MSIKGNPKDISFSKQLILLTFQKLGYLPNYTGFEKVKELTGINSDTINNVVTEASREFTFDKVLKILGIFGISGQDLINLIEKSTEVKESKAIVLFDESKPKAAFKNPWR